VLELRKKSVRVLLEKLGGLRQIHSPPKSALVAQKRSDVARLLQGRAVSHYLDLPSLVNDLSHDQVHGIIYFLHPTAAEGAFLLGLSGDVAALLKAGKELPDEMASQPPSFPESYYNQWSNYTETATHTYNFCISPITPHAVRGVVWIPSQKNIGEDVSRYEPALNAYANSLAETYGQDKVTFAYAQPTAKLVEGITKSQIKNSMSVEFDAWPRSLKDIAARLGALAAEK